MYNIQADAAVEVLFVYFNSDINGYVKFVLDFKSYNESQSRVIKIIKCSLRAKVH